MRIHLVGPAGVQIFSHGPWNAFSASLERLGGEVTCSYGNAPVPKADICVSLWDTLRLRRVLRTKYESEQLVQIVLEPPSTSPLTYSLRRQTPFGHRFAASHRWARILNGRSFPWPQEIDPRSELDSARDAASAVAVAFYGNKFSASDESYYRLRRQVVLTALDDDLPLTLYGAGWSDSRFVQFMRGVKAVGRSLVAGGRPSISEAFRTQAVLKRVTWAPDEDAVLRQAQLAVVIENSGDYVSEKLFAPLRLGVVPLYVGPPLAEFGIPGDIAIEVPPDPMAILEALRRTSQLDLDNIRIRGREWLSSPDARRHRSDIVIGQLAEWVVATYRGDV